MMKPILLLLFFVLCAPPRAQASPPNNLHLMPEAAAKALASADEAVLYSLNPMAGVGMGGFKGDDAFHGWKFLGKTALKGDAAKQAATEFQAAVDRSKDDNTQALCFEPRHGLEVKSDGHVFDFVLCYECRGMAVYEDGKPLASLIAKGSPAPLNKILQAAHVELPAQPE